MAQQALTIRAGAEGPWSRDLDTANWGFEPDPGHFLAVEFGTTKPPTNHFCKMGMVGSRSYRVVRDWSSVNSSSITTLAPGFAAGAK